MKKASEILEQVNSMYNLKLTQVQLRDILYLMKKTCLVTPKRESSKEGNMYGDNDVEIICRVMKHRGDGLPRSKAICKAVEEKYGEQLNRVPREILEQACKGKFSYVSGEILDETSFREIYDRIYKEVSSYAPEMRLLEKIFWKNCYRDWIMEFLSSHPPRGDKHNYKMNAIKAIKQQIEQDYKLGGLGNLIEETLNTLSPSERKVLQLLYGLEDGKPRSLREVGEELKRPRETVRRIEARALKKIKYSPKSIAIKNYLDDAREKVVDRRMKRIEKYIELGIADDDVAFLYRKMKRIESGIASDHDVFLHKLYKLSVIFLQNLFEQKLGVIDDLGLSARVNNALKRAGISTTAELITKTPKELLSIRSFGEKSLMRVKEKLSERGLSLRE